MTTNDSKTRQKNGQLSAIWRKFAASTALATVLLGGAMPASAQNGPPQAQNGTGAAAVEQAPPDLREMEYRMEVRLALITAARENFMMSKIQTGDAYSRDLGVLGDRLTLSLQHMQGLHNRVALLDPARFDAGTALGLPAMMVIQLMLREQGVEMEPARVRDVAGNMASFFEFGFGLVKTQNPSAFVNMTGAAGEACVVVPSSAHALPFNLPGMTFQQKIAFVNTHESWHCLDSRYPMQGFDQEAVEKEMKKPHAARDNAAVREFIALRYNKEALADVGGLGDLIRSGKADLGAIDAVSDWRKRELGDVLHFSPPVLAELKSRIVKMGLPAFRALNDSQAQALYFSVMDAKELTAPIVAYTVMLEDAKTPAQNRALKILAGQDPDFIRAQEFRRHYVAAEKAAKAAARHAPKAGTPLTEQEKAGMERVRAWNASAMLQERAFALHGKITPETMIYAYGALQTALMDGIKQRPDNAALPVLMTKLQQTYLNDVRRIDYVAANARHGVDIAAVEPVLKNIPKPGAVPLLRQQQPKPAW
jgi:hypothetical protein